MTLFKYYSAFFWATPRFTSPPRLFAFCSLNPVPPLSPSSPFSFLTEFENAKLQLGSDSIIWFINLFIVSSLGFFFKIDLIKDSSCFLLDRNLMIFFVLFEKSELNDSHFQIRSRCSSLFRCTLFWTRHVEVSSRHVGKCSTFPRKRRTSDADVSVTEVSGTERCLRNRRRKIWQKERTRGRKGCKKKSVEMNRG